MRSTFQRLVPVGTQLQRLVVVLDGETILLLLNVQISQVQMGIGHARIEAERFAVRLDGQIELASTAVDQTEIVIPLDALWIELNAAAKGGDGLIEFLQEIKDGPQIDVRAGAERIETGDFAEVMCGAGQLAELEIDRGQAHVNVRSVGAQPERHEIGLFSLFPVAVFDGLPGLEAQTFNLPRFHDSPLRIEARRDSGRASPKSYL